MEYVMPLALGITGVVLGSILNYFILKRLFKGQVTSVVSIFEGTETGKEVAQMIHKINKFSEGEDMKRILKKLEKALDDLIGEGGDGTS